MFNKLMTAALATLSLLITGCSGFPWRSSDWMPVDQPNLAKELSEAQIIVPETLAEGPKSVFVYDERELVPNPDRKTYDLLQWYWKGYSGPTWLYALDLGAGESKCIRFPDNRQVNIAGRTLAFDGNYYIVTPDLPFDKSKGMDMFVYDPGRNELEDRGQIVPDLTGERRPIVAGQDGKIYGTGSYRKESKAGLYSYDPKTRQVRIYGPVGPSHKPNDVWGYYIGVCDTHAYVASGKIPWYLLSVELDSGKVEVLEQTPVEAANTEIGISMINGWPRASVEKGDGIRKEYWLRGGKMYPKALNDNTPPWPRPPSPEDGAAPEPQIHADQATPDADGRCAIWYRDKSKRDDPAKTPEENGWRRIAYGPVETYPLSIHRLAALPDGRLFGTAGGYIGRFIYDPAQNRTTLLGNGGCSIYPVLVHDGKVFWGGYSNMPIEVYDPARPWTLGQGGPPGRPSPDIEDPGSNPRRLFYLYEQTRVKKAFSAVAAADGRLYFGGIGQRDYAGGGLGWFDPVTGERDGMWKPFSAYRICWLATACDGRYVVASTRTVEDILRNNKEPAEARLFVYDTQTHELVRDFVPVRKGRGERTERGGPLLEVAPGRMLGVNHDPENKDGGVIYGVDALKGRRLFIKRVPLQPEIKWSEGTSQKWDFVKGPDGKIYTYLKDVLVRIAPEDARVTVLGRLERPGKMCFVGPDLYLTGGMNIRRIRGLIADADMKN